MSGRIPQQFIDDLIARADIAEVIGSRVRLQKAGREYKACCPFHNEKTPSFTVSPTKQFYHCFGCGAHGTAIGFLMEFDGLGFIEAIEDLASQVGIEVPREAGAKQGPSRVDYYATLAEAAAFYRRSLKQSVPAVDYLKNRGLNGETVTAFGIGYAPDSWEALGKNVGTDDDSRQHLIETGMLKPRREGRGWFDMFRDRIMFPIRDTRGRVIAFGGRTLGDGEPKYLNSPESDLFHKGRELYGLYEARQANRDIDTLVVVEGYMDVVALAQYGIHNAVATLGTACTEAHLDKLFRVADNVVICFDGDAAGRRAAWRALENALGGMREGRQVRFLFLPDGHDPDSLVAEEGAAGFNSRLADSQPLSEYLVSHLGEQVDLGSVDGRAKFVELARPLLARLPAGVYREMMIDRLAQTARIDSRRLRGLLGESVTSTSQTRVRRPQRPGERGNRVRQAIKLLLQHPAALQYAEVPDGLATLDRPGIPVLCQLVADLRTDPNLSTAAILERWRDHEVGN
ncbi:MAG: DNA primase, partial [Gammaproteobacteria bacterium]|nr:DNA primase [Gammaproteobacteria bacterium]